MNVADIHMFDRNGVTLKVATKRVGHTVHEYLGMRNLHAKSNDMD